MARGPQRQGAQCSCIGLRPALYTRPDFEEVVPDAIMHM